MTSLELDAIMKRAEMFQLLYNSDVVRSADEWRKLAAEAHNDRDALLLVIVDDPNTYVQRMVRGVPLSNNIVPFPEPKSNEVQPKKNQTVILADDIQKYGFDEALRRSEKR